MCRAKCLRRFLADADYLLKRQGSALDAVLQGLAFEQLHDEIGIAVLLPDVEDGADVRVVECGSRARLAQKALPHAGHAELIVQQLDGHLTMETGVPGTEDGAHATAAKAAEDLVGPEPPACLRNHALSSPSLVQRSQLARFCRAYSA